MLSREVLKQKILEWFRSQPSSKYPSDFAIEYHMDPRLCYELTMELVEEGKLIVDSIA